MSPGVSEAGACAVLLRPELRARIGWQPSASRPPDRAWEAAEGRAGLSDGERTMVACALALWNGTRAGVDVAALARLDGRNLGRLSRAFGALSDGSGLAGWAAAELAREVRASEVGRSDA